MNSIAPLALKLSEGIKSSRTAGPVILAVIIGGLTGVAAVVFRLLLNGTRSVFYEWFGPTIEPTFGIFYVIPLVAFGGLLVGFISRYDSPETRGDGVPEVMGAIARYGGRIRARVAPLKAVAASITIGSGGAGGLIGPLVQIGSSLGSTVGQVFRLPDRRVTLCVACGSAGAISATFNAPIAGVLFALEVILGRFTAPTFGMVVLSSTAATAVSRACLGDDTAFALRTEYGLASPWEFFTYAMLGVLCALVAQLFIRALFGVRDALDGLKVPELFRPAIGGALVGLIGVKAPEILGLGTGHVERTLEAAPGTVAIGSLLLLCVAKLVGASLTVGSNGSAGVFAPALFIGATFGGAFGGTLNRLLPGVVGAPGGYALVGMAAVFAGVAHAPITAILIIFEMTDDYGIILPLMAATVLSTLLSQRLSAESYYTLRLQRWGILVGNAPEVNLMDGIFVRDAMTTEFEWVPPRMPLTGLAIRLANSRQSGYPVIDNEGKLVGVVTQYDVETALVDRNPSELTVGDICTKDAIVCRPDQTLSTALAQFGARDIGRLPVVDPEQPGRVIGMLRRSGVISAYAQAFTRRADVAKDVDKMKAFTELSDTVVLKETIKANAPLAETLVRDAHFPEGSILIYVRRDEENHIPAGSTLLTTGDTILVLSTRQRAESVRKWLSKQC